MNKPKYKRKINKIFSIGSLMAILCGVLVYLDMINYLSLQNIVSVILGFLVMIFVQMRLISYFYEAKMKQLDLDQFGIIKDLINSKLFGQINLNYISKKAKQKYYHHTKDQNDKLFADENQQTFECVITTLRAKNEVDHQNKIQALKDKWDLLLVRINNFEIFLTNLLKIYKQRSLAYKRFNQKVSTIPDYDMQCWEVLFVKEPQIIMTQNNQYTKHLGMNDGTDWTDMKKVILERYHIVQSKTKQIFSQLLTQFKAFSSELKAEHRQTMTQLENSFTQLTNSKKMYRDIVQKIEMTSKKITMLKQKIKVTRSKGSTNMEAVFNTQYDLRFLFVELDNLEVKKTYVKDMNHKAVETLLKLCNEKENSLQSSWIKKFNNKISHYLVSYFDKMKMLIPKHKEHKIKNNDELIKLQYAYSSNTKKAYQNLHQINRRLNQFKSYLPDLLILHQQEIKNIKKISDLIKEYEKQVLNLNQFKFAQDMSIGEKIIDSMFFELLESVNRKQTEILSKTINLFREQQIFIDKKQQKKQIMLKLSSLKKKQGKQKQMEQIQSQIKNGVKNSYYPQGQSVSLASAYEFEQNNKITSCLYEILLCSVEGYTIINEEIQQRKEEVELKVTFFGTTDTKQVRMNQYKDELFKLEREEFIKQEQYGKAGETDKKDYSLLIINKILTVFVNQWKNSCFFHQILKEEIQISLNQKRPAILSYMTLKYIKIEQNQGELLQNINLLGDNVFICLFEVLINFKGKVALHIETELKNQKIPINIKILLTQFKCPLRICFTPFSLGKSYVSMMRPPKLRVEYNAKIGNWEISKIPFISLFIQIFIVIKLRKKFLYPKRATIKVPLAVKNAIAEAIKERTLYEKLLQKKRKSD